MHFRVGPHLYRIRISAGILLDEDRTPVDGLCCWSDRVIWINGRLPLAQRIDVLVHELAHAYEQHYGIATDSEGAANQKATFFLELWKQLNGYGGIDALLRLTPNGVRDHAQAEDVPNDSYCVQCGNEACQEKIAMGSVTTSKARFDPVAQRPVADRRVRCPNCGTRMTWTEGLTAGGLPNGRVISGPKLHRARAHSLDS